MAVFKKLIFGPLFLLTFAFLIFQLKSNLGSYDVIFSLSITTLAQLLLLSGLICLSSFLFVLFVSLSSDWKIVLPVGIVASILPIIVIRDATGIILCLGVGLTILFIYFTFTQKLKTYLSFEPASLFGPSIRHMAALLILVFSFTYFLSMNKIIQTQGFQIPASLIDSALKLTDQPQTIQEETTISQAPANLMQETLKQAVKTQLDSIIKPYLGAVPAILAVLLFFLLQSLTSLINLLIYPLLWILFYIFEKTGFIKFTEEQKTLRKMVV